MSILLPPAELVHKHWSNIAGYEKIGQEFKQHLIDICALSPHHNILDVGSGIGRIAIALAEYLDMGHYEGFDIIPEGVKWCQDNITFHYPNFHFQVANIYNRKYNPRGVCRASEFLFPYGREWFDIVVLTSVFTHMRPDAIQRYLDEITRVLRPGGRCLITWYLLDNRSRWLMQQDQTLFNFEHKLEGFWTTHKEMPDVAVALNDYDVIDMYTHSNLCIDEIYPGFWCNLQNKEGALSSQDVIVATKK